MKRNNSESKRQRFIVIMIAAMALMLSVFMAACGDDSGEAAKDRAMTTATEQKESEEATEASLEEAEEQETTQAETVENTQPTQASTEAKTENKPSVKNATKARTENKSSTKEAAGRTVTESTKAAEKQKAVCYITIQGYCSDKEIAIQNGDTVYDILKRSGAPVSARSSGYGIYIEAINGLAEFDKGPTSGWKYSVNGVDPGYGCDSYSVKQGDRINWYYVLEP